jgi:hypothetical protein
VSLVEYAEGLLGQVGKDQKHRPELRVGGRPLHSVEIAQAAPDHFGQQVDTRGDANYA